MPEYLRSLAIILVLATGVFAFAKTPVCVSAINRDDFRRRRNLWLGLTCAAFLANSFWIFIVTSAIMLLSMARQEKNIPALFFFVLFAVPRISAEIPGLGLVNYFFAVDYVRLLALTVLLPAFLTLRKREAKGRDRWARADMFLVAYIALSLILQFTVDTATNTLRYGFYAFIDVYLPFYVISRSLKDIQSFRDALTSYVLATMILAAIGIFEFSWHWLLYNELSKHLGVPWDLSGYLLRGDSLRAQASTGQPIILGYVVAVALGLWGFAKDLVPSRFDKLLGWVLLVAGLAAPLSRGPWVGAAATLFVLIAAGPQSFRRIGLLGLAGLAALSILAPTTLGQKIVDYLPFVGTIDINNISYRERLLEISIEIIGQNPFFGSFDYLPQMEELRSGGAGGIIDLVNSFATIALSSGLVGLSLFVGVFVSVLLSIVNGMRCLARDHELHVLGRALLAANIGALVIIATVSSISVVAVVYWSMAGLGLAYSRLLEKTLDLRKDPISVQSQTQSYTSLPGKSAPRQALH